MKKNLVDISLTELREFIKNAEESSHLSLSGLSLISIKLRLQFLILQNQFTDFGSFYKFYLEDEDYKASIHLNLITQGNELFRDAECWDLFINEIVKCSAPTNICLFDTGNFYDIVTFLICIERFDLLSKINLTLVILTNKNTFSFTQFFTEKDIEMGQINFTALKSQKTLTDFIIPAQKNKYQYIVSNELALNVLTLDEILIQDIKFDAVIARNITLNYNFSSHEKLFNDYLSILKNKGILFTGNKEGFKWCNQFKSIAYSNKSIPIYKKL